MPPANKTPFEISLEIPKLPDMETLVAEMARMAGEYVELQGKAEEIRAYLKEAVTTLKINQRMMVRIRLSGHQLEFETQVDPIWIRPGPQTPIPPSYLN